MNRKKCMYAIKFQVKDGKGNFEISEEHRFKKLVRFILTFFIIAIAISIFGGGGIEARGAGSPFPIQPPLQTVFVPMPDGVKLATSVYLPRGRGPWPVLLIRTPYGRHYFDGAAATVTSMGIALIVQDTRGRFDSEGVHGVFFNEKADGQATLNWVLDQRWSKPRVATFGGSALGISQYLMAPGAAEALVCQWVEAATPDLYADAVYQGGVYRSDLANGFLALFNGLDLAETWWSNYLNTPYWDPVQITNDYGDVHAVAVHIGGWYDIFVRGTVNAFLGYQKQGGTGAKGKQHLIIGAWTHSTLNTSAATGQLTFPNAVSPDYYVWSNTWLGDCLLDGGSSLANTDDLDALAAVRYYTMGAVGESGAPGNQWRTADTWPPTGSAEIPLYLSSDKTLSYDEPNADVPGDTFSYNPFKPTPTIGGNNFYLPSGAYDQRLIEQREDVVVYSTEALEQPVEVTGDVRADIWITTDVPDTDLVVRLTDVYPDGRSMLVADGILRARYNMSPEFTSETVLERYIPYLLEVDLGPTSIIFNKGHRIRISVASSNTPRFSPNPNTGAMFLDGGTGQIATTTILHDATYPSAIILPIIEGKL